jgi:hypothetical protein
MSPGAATASAKWSAKALKFAADGSRNELYAAGKALRVKCPRTSHAAWRPPYDRPDPVALVLKSEKGR